MKKPQRRKCAHCREWFYPVRNGQLVCSIECVGAYGRQQTDKARSKAAQLAKQRQRDKQKEDRAAWRERKEKLKTKPDWMKEAQAAFNRYIRIRDAGKPCISCGALPEQKFGGTMDCGHYRSRGAASHLRFNLLNVAAQDVHCNRDLSGNASGFRMGLIERIGLEKVLMLEADNTPRKFDIEYLKRIKVIFTKKSRMLEKRRSRMEVAA